MNAKFQSVAWKHQICSHFRDSLERIQCPNPQALMGIYDKGDVLGVIVTVRGATPYDFLSRYFAPWNGIPEDPVTGAYIPIAFTDHLYRTPLPNTYRQINSFTRRFTLWLVRVVDHSADSTDLGAGSAHTVLASYWAEQLGKSKFTGESQHGTSSSRSGENSNGSNIVTWYNILIVVI